MDQRREYTLEVFADQAYVKDIVKGILHTVFFHRYFPSIRPALFPPSSSSHSSRASSNHPPLPLALPAILDPPEIETLIESRTQTLIHQLTSSSTQNGGGVRGELAVQFFDRKRRKPVTSAGGWLGRLGGVTGVAGGSADEEVCWEEWVVEVVVARPRTEADQIKVRRAMESSLLKTAMKIVGIVNRDRDHIPPITTSETNPFPYRIVVNPKQALAQQGLEGYGQSHGRGFGGWG